MAIFGGTSKVEPQFKKIYKSRTISTGMSELLRDLDKDFATYDHLDLLSKAKDTKEAPAIQKWCVKLEKASESIDKIFKNKKIDWTTAESTFLKKLIQEIDDHKTALTQLVDKASKEQKSPKDESSTEETLLKVQAELLTKHFPNWMQRLKEGADKDLDKFDEYVKTQEKLVLEIVKTGSAKEDVESTTIRLERLEELIDNCKKNSINAIDAEMAKKVEPACKTAKICSNNKKIQELDKKIREEEKAVKLWVDKLQQRVLLLKNSLWRLKEKLEQASN